MKKKNILLTTFLIVFPCLLLVGCGLLGSKTNTGKNSPTTAGKFSQFQFMPFIKSNASTAETQTTPAPNSFATPYVAPSGAHSQDLPPEKWQEWPVIPVISDRALDIFRAGIAQGNDPTHFSKVGDCQMHICRKRSTTIPVVGTASVKRCALVSTWLLY
jgi:hypothetical protein